MELDEIKLFLRVDFDEDDTLIQLIANAAEEYITAAVGSCDYTKARVKLLALVIITELYEKRSFSVEKAGEKAQYTIRSIISQLQAEEAISNDD
jgi:uncharacterized phage protein (predicted DNA packaging)